MRMMKIHLSQPFEHVLATALTLPHARPNVRASLEDDAKFKQVIRGLYEAANGRQVETTLGLIAIAPPVAGFLKAEPFLIATRVELLVEAAARILLGPRLGIGNGANEMLRLLREEKPKDPNSIPRSRHATACSRRVARVLRTGLLALTQPLKR